MARVETMKGKFMGKHCSQDYYWVGGARVGRCKSAYGTAELEVNEQMLVLRLGDYSEYFFKPSQVTGIIPCTFDEVPSKGVRILHRLANYPEEVLFQTVSGNLEALLFRLWSLGYGGVLKADNAAEARISPALINLPNQTTPGSIRHLRRE